jgi:hypothetical protein
MDGAKYPDERWRASCPRTAAALLLRYDHHVVWIDGRRALLRTCHGAAEPLSDAAAMLLFEVSFTFAAGHPSAPAEVQAIVDGIAFVPPRAHGFTPGRISSASPDTDSSTNRRDWS